VNRDITGTLAATLKHITVAATETAAPAIDGVATVQGVQATISAGDDVRGSSFSRNQINQFCRTKYTRAVAWCLHIFADDHRMSVPQICAWLDEIGVASPMKNKSWGRCYDDDKLPWDQYSLEKMVSEQRKFMREKLGKVNQ
jgi:hypothetical protein